MSEQELRQQIFDLEDEQLKKYQKLNPNNIDNFNLFLKLRNSQEIKNASIRKCLNNTLDAFFNNSNIRNINFFLFVYKNNQVIDTTECFYLTKKTYFESHELKHKSIFKTCEEIKNFMDLSKNDVCQKYLIEHEKYTENLVIKILTKEKHNDTFICVFISLK